jgi:hypothetical protein
VLIAIFNKIFVHIYKGITKRDFYQIVKKTSILPTEKRLQNISQNPTHISIVMPYSNEIMDELRNIFRIKRSYKPGYVLY